VIHRLELSTFCVAVTLPEGIDRKTSGFISIVSIVNSSETVCCVSLGDRSRSILQTWQRRLLHPTATTTSPGGSGTLRRLTKTLGRSLRATTL